MKKTLPFVLLFFALAVHSQSFQWVNTAPITFSSNSQLISYSVTTDPSDNVYMVGYKDNPFPFNDILGNQYYNKYDTNGNLVFSNEITGHVSVYNMTTDGDGNVIMMLGYVESVTMGDFGLISINQGVNHVMVKLNNLGTVLWYREFSTSIAVVSQAIAVTTDAANNIYVGYDNYIDSYVEKLSPSGTLLLTINQLDVQQLTSVSVDDEGNIYVAGSCANVGATFANVAAPLPVGMTYNVYVVKYSPDTVFQWVKYIEDITCPVPQVKARTADAVYLCSELYGAYSFDNIMLQGPTAGNTDVFIAKLNSAGDFQWAREVPDAGTLARGNRNAIDVDDAGNVYFGGQTLGTIDWGNGVQTSTGAAFGATDAIVLKFDSNGVAQMAKLFGGANYDRVDGLSINNDGAIIVTGLVKGDTVFDAFTFTAASSQAYPFIAKLSNPMLSTNAPDAIKATLYPNPSADWLYISNVSSVINGVICNVMGQEVLSFVVNADEPIAIRTLAKGTYLIKIKDMKPLKFIKL